jgi:hypothetical protein
LLVFEEIEREGLLKREKGETPNHQKVTKSKRRETNNPNNRQGLLYMKGKESFVIIVFERQ